MSSAAEFSDTITDMITPKIRNKAGIYGVKFYIRGKPWVVHVDDYMLFTNSVYPNLYFAKEYTYSDRRSTMWGPIIEKAWAKMKASYINSDYGYVANGIRSLTGSPVFH